MGLPLPKVVADVGPGGPLVTAMGGMNALSGQMLDNQIKGVKAQYAPYNEYANAASHISYANMLPFQIQASILSNPLVWQSLKGQPNALQGMLQNFSQSFPKGGQPFGGINIPVPGQQQGNVLSRIKNWLAGDQQPVQQALSNPMTQQAGMPVQQQQMPNQMPMQQPDMQAQAQVPQATTSTNDSYLSPASQGPTEGVIGAKTAEFTEQPFKPGLTATIGDKNVSVPAGTTVADIQRAIIGIKTVAPTLQRIANGAEEFLAKGQKGKSLLTQLNDNIQQYGNIDLIPDSVKKKLGIDSDLLSRYTKWQGDIEKVPEALVKALDLPQGEGSLHRVDKIIKPVPGEMGPGYKKRVMDELAELVEVRAPMYSSILRSGMNVDKVDPSKITMKTESKPVTTKPVKTGADILSKQIQLPNFKDQAEFQAWYRRQPAVTKKAVNEHLRNR